jgi:hypothetical protein
MLPNNIKTINAASNRLHLNTTSTVVALASLFATAAALAGCGPTFDPPSLIESTRVVGARVEVAGDAGRATPAPGEAATVTWLMAAPGAMPSIGWAFALCAPGAPSALSCDGAPIAIYQGSENPPRVALTVPGAAQIGDGKSLILYGRICAGSVPELDASTGVPACTGGGEGTTVSVVIGVQSNGLDANHNPVADRGVTFDGQPWPAPVAGDDACASGPRVSAGSDDHVIAVATAAGDRESYTTLYGDPAVPTAFREALQISHFATAGKLKSPYSFIEGDAGDDAPAAQVKWNAPKAADVSGATAVPFRFVVRDSRGGIDWTARELCVTP